MEYEKQFVVPEKEAMCDKESAKSPVHILDNNWTRRPVLTRLVAYVLDFLLLLLLLLLLLSFKIYPCC